MKNILILMITIIVCLSFCGCGTDDKIGDFVDNNIEIYKDVNEYITVDNLKERYVNYDGGYGDFYIENIGETKCYGNVSYIDNEEKCVSNIYFKFKDAKGNESEKFIEKLQEICKTRYTGESYEKAINDKYEINRLGIDGVCVELNNEESDKCRAELAGITVEEYKTQISKALAGAYSKMEIDENRDWLIIAAKNEIKKQLLSPKSAKFPYADSFKVENMGDGEYIVTVDVTYKNAYNVEISNTFSVWLRGTGESNYSLVDITSNY